MTCGSPYTLVGNECLYFMVFAKVTFQEAHYTCQTADGGLANIISATQMKAVVDYIKFSDFKSKDFWLDGTDSEEEGKWTTVSGQPILMGTPFWASYLAHDEPNDYLHKEDCLVLSYDEFYYMNDVSCDDKSHPLCQAPPTLTAEDEGAATALSGSLECPFMFNPVGGLCLAFVLWEKLSWTDARQICHGMNGDLVAITDIEVLRALYMHLQDENIADHTFWVGGSDAEEGDWRWTTNEAVDMGTPFWGLYKYQQEPTAGIFGNCLTLKSPGGYYFRDDSCHEKHNPLCMYVEP
ncbi:C-type lectin-like 22 [Homarus americanus]|uniref:C-type lectin-like 22 n=2 Tax=Homarus americanus TaxID=6706 RepID=A0A8J5MPC9_HOMAM|nr:C-type lectin-like 22 [Homarus americanus]